MARGLDKTYKDYKEMPESSIIARGKTYAGSAFVITKALERSSNNKMQQRCSIYVGMNPDNTLTRIFSIHPHPGTDLWREIIIFMIRSKSFETFSETNMRAGAAMTQVASDLYRVLRPHRMPVFTDFSLDEMAAYLDPQAWQSAGAENFFMELALDLLPFWEKGKPTVEYSVFREEGWRWVDLIFSN